MGTPRSKPNTPKPETQTTGNTTGTRGVPPGQYTGGRGVGTSVTPSDVFPSTGNKPTPPSMPRPAPMRQATAASKNIKGATAAMKKGGMAKMKKDEMPSKMGKVKTSPKADGVAMKGKTKGTMVKMKKMAYGGKC